MPIRHFCLCTQIKWTHMNLRQYIKRTDQFIRLGMTIPTRFIANKFSLWFLYTILGYLAFAIWLSEGEWYMACRHHPISNGYFVVSQQFDTANRNVNTVNLLSINLFSLCLFVCLQLTRNKYRMIFQKWLSKTQQILYFHSMEFNAETVCLMGIIII